MSNKIVENWTTIQEIEKKVREQTGDPEAGFNASSFWFGSDGRHLMIPAMYRTKTGEKFSKSYKDMMVYAKFCPFTGKPLYDDSIEVPSEESVTLNDIFTLGLVDEFKKGDVFLWKSISGSYEVHTFHSDAGYGIKTFTDYDDNDGSSLIVNFSGVCGILEIN